MNEKRNPEVRRKARLDDLRKRRDRILVHPRLGPQFRRWATTRAKTTNGDVFYEYEVVDPVEKAVNEVRSVMDASARILLDKLGFGVE